MRPATRSHHADVQPLVHPPERLMVTSATHRRSRSRRQQWVARGVVTGAAWLVAFIVVLALFTLFGEELEALPLAWRALVVSGILVNLMANLVMPVVILGVARLFGGPPPAPFGRAADQAVHEGGTTS